MAHQIHRLNRHIMVMTATKSLLGILTIAAGLMTQAGFTYGASWVGTDGFSSAIYSSTNWTFLQQALGQMTIQVTNGHASFLDPTSTTDHERAWMVWNGTPTVADGWMVDILGHNTVPHGDGGSSLYLGVLDTEAWAGGSGQGSGQFYMFGVGMGQHSGGSSFGTVLHSPSSDTNPVVVPCTKNTLFGLRLLYKPASQTIEAYYDPTGSGSGWTELDSITVSEMSPGMTASSTFSFAIVADTFYGPISEGQMWAGNFSVTNSAIPNSTNGSLQLTIAPPAAVSAGAAWQVDGSGYQKSGATLNNLQVGDLTVTFKPIAGWSTPASETVTITGGVTTQAAGVYTQQVKGNPKLTISSPTSGQSVTNALLMVTGTVTDKVAVDGVYYQLNGGSWTLATTTNSWTHWTASVSLNPGTNTISAYATDTSGSVSPTKTVKCVYILTAPVEVQIARVGMVTPGTVTPNYSGKWLDIGNDYSMTAKADKGFAFSDWSWSGGSTNNPTLKFLMAPNLSFTANFVDVQRPVLAILSPKANAKVTAEPLTVTGKASDNVGVASVFCQLNGAGWSQAETANGYSNWTASVTLSQSNNTLQAYAQDAAGNKSLTNTVKFTYTGSVIGPTGGDLAPASLSGLSAEVTPTNDTTGFTISFGASTFSQSMGPGTNEDNNSVGNYTYARLSTNTALLTVTPTAPPDNTNASFVGLTFTDSQHATFNSTNSDGGIGAGTMHLTPAQNLAPTSVAGKTVTSSSGGTAKFNTDGTFTLTGNGQNKSGDYTYAQYSPVGAMVVITNSGGSTDTGYLELTFTSTTAGSMIETDFDSSGAFQWIYTGTFTWK